MKFLHFTYTNKLPNTCITLTINKTLSDREHRKVRLTATVITGVSFGSGTTDRTMTLSDDSIFNCSVIRWVKSASLMMPTYGLGIL